MSSPAFQFYPADYLADANVQMMTLEEEGAYIRLLSYCWRESTIPADNASLSRLCKGASDEVLNTVKQMFVVVPKDVHRMHHLRLEEEQKNRKNSEKNERRPGLLPVSHEGKSR
jgi:uncharacterized protein YdaU (DUF1376 family)